MNRLFQDFHCPTTTVQFRLSGRIQITTKFREGFQLTVGSEVDTKGTSNLLHSLDLSRSTNPGNRRSGINGWTNTGIKQIILQEDLSVCDRNHIGCDISGDVPCLGFNDWKSCNRTPTQFIRNFRRTFQQTAVEIEDIPWEGFTSWWTTKKKGQFTVSYGLF